MGKKKISLTTWILMSMILGVIVGTVLFYLLPQEMRESYLQKLSIGGNSDNIEALKLTAAKHWINFYLIDGLFNIGAAIFIKTLKMLVVPLVLVSLVCGVNSIGDPKKLGRVGGKTILLYLLTTAIAITLGLTAANLFSVGAGSELISNAGFKTLQSQPLSQVIINIVPANPIKAMSEGIMLQVIFFAILFGLSITLLGEKANAIKKFFADLNEIIMKMVTILMGFAPIGVFCVVAKVFGQKGLDPIQDLLKYFVVMVCVLILHATGVYGGLLKLFAGLNPFRFFENIRPIIMMGFSTASSNATIPVTLNTVEKNLGVDNSVASFTVPLGATINMDGTAIMQGIATVFIANAAGINLSFTQYLLVILTATLASIGTAGVPGVGMITLAMVLRQVGLPEQGILLLLPVDRILDMCRTSVNVCGDAAVTCIVAKSENQLDKKIFDQPLGDNYGEYNFEKKK